MDNTITTYNGWSNRETWLVSLWLNNERESYALLCRALSEPGEMYDQARWLEEELRDQLDDDALDASLWSDLLSTAFERINWVEVIENN